MKMSKSNVWQLSTKYHQVNFKYHYVPQHSKTKEEAKEVAGPSGNNLELISSG